MHIFKILARNNTISLANSFKEKVDEYFKRLSVLTGQIPFKLRLSLLPEYMTWDTFQSDILIDPFGNFGFKIHRKSETKLEIKIKSIHDPVEKKIFFFYNPQSNILKCTSALGTIISYNEITVDRYRGRHQGILIMDNSDARFIQNDIETSHTDHERFFERVYFAWIVHKSLVNLLDPVSYADEDFNDGLFSKIREIIEGFRYSEEDHTKVIGFYIELLQKIEKEISDKIRITQSDEWTFQQLLTNYKFFLYPNANSITSNYIIKSKYMVRKPDFHINVNNIKRIDVEIEPPFYKPFEGENISSRLQGALNQILDWKQISSANRDKTNICYIIIIGLKADLNATELENLQKFNEKQTDLLVVTWDWIVDNVKQVIDDLKNKI